MTLRFLSFINLSIRQMCRIDKHLSQICRDDSLWQTVTEIYFPEVILKVGYTPEILLVMGWLNY